MTPKEIQTLAARVDLNIKQLAPMIGVDQRTLRRGLRKGSTADLILRGFQAQLDDPYKFRSIRALMLMSAQQEMGLAALFGKLLNNYVIVDTYSPPR